MLDVEVIIPLDGDSAHCLNPPRSYKTTVLHEWLPVALGNIGMRMGLYLCACRSLHARTGSTRYYQRALQYKAVCLRLLAEFVKAECTSDAPTISDTTISVVLQLASDEVRQHMFFPLPPLHRLP
ncbi:hypothetical protein F4802DRAFT_589105 [Xylaria palmicola]|nr:hypothetical protein F4802DRAFT_589105 [Xylaria palmicola]